MSTANNVLSLAGKLCLVTGASSGLGMHFARTLANHGAKVAVAARRVDRLDALVEELMLGGAAGVCAVRMDVRDETSIKAGVKQQVEQILGPIDVLVNNAGVAVQSPSLKQTRREWEKVLDTNLVGPFLVAQAVARSMVRDKRSGSIINISSVSGMVPSSGLAAYCSSKAGLTHLTKVLALEWARHGIRVNAVCPGYFKTEMNSDFFDTPNGDRIVKAIPMRRLGDPSELDGLLLMLASERASSYMTGSVLTLDGGIMLSHL
ncbi:unnamed protein product [Ectocarpus sp. 8 AP-2014]